MRSVKILFVFICFFFLVPIYTAYNFYGDIAFEYEMRFSGEVILSSQVFNYTNTNAKFSIDFSVKTCSQYTDNNQVIIDFLFSPIKKSNLPDIFSTLWDKWIQNHKKELAYAVTTVSNQLFIFDKQGSQNSLGYFFQNIFPMIDFDKKYYNKEYRLINQRNNPYSDTTLITIEGWELFQKKQSVSPNVLNILEKNPQLISNMYVLDYFNKKEKANLLFWMQSFDSFQTDVFNQNKNNISLIGFYVVDKNIHSLVKSMHTGSMSMEIPFQSMNAELPITLFLRGTFENNIKNN